MNRAPLLIAGVATIGIGLALVVFQAPDTGGDLPAVVERAPVAPVAATTPAPPPEVLEQPDENQAPPVKDKFIEERRAMPDALNAGTQAAAWTGIRREFLRAEGDRAIVDDMSKLISELRDARRNPDAADFDAIGAHQNDVRRQVDASGLVSGSIKDLLDRLDAI